MEPTRPADRIPSLDVLRGLAVLGILAVNAPFFAAPIYQAFYPAIWPFPDNPASLGVWAATQILFTSKFITLFSMLFGISLYLVGGETREPERGRILTRRLVWLMVFGAAHGLLIWSGDILFAYAICGLALAPLRSLKPAALLLLGGIAYGLNAGWSLIEAAEQARQGLAGAYDPTFPHQAGFGGDFRDSLRANMLDWLMISLQAEIRAVFFAGPLMLIGLGLFKAGALQARRLWLPIVPGALALAFAAWLTARQLHSDFSPYWQVWADQGAYLTAPVVTLGYAALVLMAIEKWAAIARLLAPVGRMAFSNYLAQSLVMTALFYGGRGPGLFGKVDRPGLALIVVAMWIVQIAASHLWLRRFSMGPAEWVWRRLTYGPVKL